MIKVELTVDELDYGSLVEQFLPELAEKLRASGNPVGMLLSNGMPSAMANGIVAGLPQAAKDKLAADLINGNAAQLRQKAEQAAAEKGIRLRVESVRAEAKAK